MYRIVNYSENKKRNREEFNIVGFELIRGPA